MSLMFEASNSNITSVNDLRMWYFISLMIKETFHILNEHIYSN